MFSVVIPLYNKQLSIKKTIESVLAQSFQDFEIIIVNDGSTDNSIDIVKSINDKRIRLVEQKNQGVSAARNRGVKESYYDWIAFLDGDDLWEQDHLSEVKKMIKKLPNNQVFVTSFEYSDRRKVFRHPRKENIFQIDNYFKEAMKEPLMWTSVVVLHKECFEILGGFNEKLNRGEDLDLWARIAKKFNIVKSSHITAIYNINVLDSLSKGRSDYHKSVLSIINLNGLYSFERKYYKKMLLLRLKANIKTFKIKETLKILKKHNIQLLH